MLKIIRRTKKRQQSKKRQRTTPRKLASLERYAHYLEKKIARTYANGTMEQCYAYIELLYDFLEENPQLKKKYPALGSITRKIDTETLATVDYFNYWRKQKANI